MELTLLEKVALALATALAAYGLSTLVQFFFSPLSDPLRLLPGPPSPGWLYGHFNAIFAAPHSVLHERWVEQYGDTLVYRVFFGRYRLFTMDPRALHHVLNHPMVYQKTEMGRFNLSMLLGNGLLVTEGQQHHQQRRVMNPAFGPAQIRGLTQIFLDKSHALRDAWAAQIETDAVDGAARIDVTDGLGKAALDVIGLAGFDYAFNALGKGQPSELYEAFQAGFSGTARGAFPFLQIAQAFIPPLRYLPTEVSRREGAGLRRMKDIGMQLVQERKKMLLEAEEGDTDRLRGRDLLTLLLKANMATDIPENQRMSDEDVLAQVPTFLVAGHETTSTSTMWCLFALSQASDVQRRLREELLSVPTETPSMDELQALPYLDAVVRETMRVHAPVPSTTRVSIADDVIPLSTPFVDRNGVSHDSIHIKKGAMIFISILAMNRSKKIWGEDAHEFRPERWLEGVPELATHIPGVWGNMLTFLGGAHACIGYRFSLIEMKCLLFSLVRAFEYKLAVPVDEIEKKSSIVTRPVLKSNRELGSHMPLLIKPYVPA